MSSGTPEGWDEVFSGPCLEADVLEAVLGAKGLRVVVRRLNAEPLWPGTVFDDCRIYVPSVQAGAARRLMAEGRDQP